MLLNLICAGFSLPEAMMPSGVQTDVKTYQMFINGEWVAEQVRQDFPRLRSLDRRSHRASSRRQRRRREPRRRRRQSRLRRRPMGHDHRAGTRSRSLPSRRQNSPELGDARRTRSSQHRQAHRRSRIRHHRRRHLLRILRRPRHQGGGPRQSRSRQRDEPLAERAGRRCRTDYSLELSAPDGRMETRSRLAAGCT